MVNLTPRDVEVLAAAFQCLKSPPDIDLEKLAVKAGYKNASSAGVCFREIKKKMLAGDSDAPTPKKTSAAPKKKATTTKKRNAPASDSEDEGDITVTTKNKAPKAKKPRAATKKNAKSKVKAEDDDDHDDDADAEAETDPDAVNGAEDAADGAEEQWPNGMNLDEGEDTGATAEELVKKETGIKDEDDEA